MWGPYLKHMEGSVRGTETDRWLLSGDWWKKREPKNGKRKNGSVDLNSSASSLMNGGFIHYLKLRASA